MQPSGSGFVKVMRIAKHQQQLDQSPCPTLDPEKQQLIQETWRQMQPRSANIGKQIFLRIFEVEPRVKEAFKLGSTWGDDLLNSEAFQRHASRFIDTIGSVVEKVDRLSEEVDSFMTGIGADHASRAGFSVEYFDVFVKSLIFVWQQELRENFTPATSDAWETLFRYMVHKTNEGYASATKVNANATKDNASATKDNANATKGNATKDNASATKDNASATKDNASATKGNASTTKCNANATKGNANATKGNANATKDNAIEKVA